jgi:hypothetical protein
LNDSTGFVGSGPNCRSSAFIRSQAKPLRAVERPVAASNRSNFRQNRHGFAREEQPPSVSSIVDAEPAVALRAAQRIVLTMEVATVDLKDSQASTRAVGLAPHGRLFWQPSAETDVGGET